MKKTEFISKGDPLPAIDSVSALEDYRVRVIWSAGTRNGREDIVDLAPLILSRKALSALRDDETMFSTVHVIEDGVAIAWGDADQIDVAATAVESLADETMTSTDFSAFLQRHALSFDAAAAQLGVSRRLVAYYAKERQIPRYIALACAYLDSTLRPAPAPLPQPQSASAN